MKAQAPFLSIGSSGSFAGVMVASSWKGRPYIRQLVTPANPKSPMQTAFRAMFKFLSQAWSPLDAGDKASWEDLASQRNVSPFNAYMAYNQDLWARALTPVVDPGNTDDAVADVTSFAGVAGVRSATITLTIDTVNDSWGAILYMEAGSAPEGTQDEVIQVIQAVTTGAQVWLVTGLTPGTEYNFKYRNFTTGGVTTGALGSVAVTPTS
jgi:hypothetical protein